MDNLEKHCIEFKTTFKSFIEELNNIKENNSINKLLLNFEKLKITKIINTLSGLFLNVGEQIEEENESLFKNNFMFLPGINLSKYWKIISSNHKKKIWIYLKLFKLTAETIHKIISNKKTQDKETFNPYIGISTDKKPLSVSDLNNNINISEISTNNGSSGIMNMMNMLGINKLLDSTGIQNELQNINLEEIEKATEHVKQLLGTKNDSSSSIINDVLNGITNEFKKGKKDGNPLENILKVAENVATQIKPKVTNKETVSNLIDSAKNLAENCKDENGNKLFEDVEGNPLNMLTNMLHKQNENRLQNPEECLEECSQILQNTGVSQEKLEEIKNLLMTEKKHKKRRHRCKK